MLKFLLAVVLVTSSLSAKSVEITEEKTKIREVREWSESIPSETTCADEFLKRRKNLSIKLGLEPLIIVGAAATGVFAGGFVGFQIYVLSGSVAGGFADLAAMASGAVIGGGIGVLASGGDSAITIVNFFRNQNLLRLIYEARNEGGEAVDGFYEKFLEMNPESQVTLAQFQTTIVELDVSGNLCNGTIVDPRRYKKGKRLKQRLANHKEIFKFISLN